MNSVRRGIMFIKGVIDIAYFCLCMFVLFNVHVMAVRDGLDDGSGSVYVKALTLFAVVYLIYSIPFFGVLHLESAINPDEYCDGCKCDD